MNEFWVKDETQRLGLAAHVSFGDYIRKLG